MQTIVIGHRNPDMDAICSAIAYAELKRACGMQNVVAGRCGNTNERIEFGLRKFGFEAPLFFSDVRPRVQDVMQRDVVSVCDTEPLYDAMRRLGDRSIRVLPVVDEFGKCKGLISSFKISDYLFPPLSRIGKSREVHTSIEDLRRTIGGNILIGETCTEVRYYTLVVGAMKTESFKTRIASMNLERTVLVVGDREDIQRLAIEAGIPAMIVSGGFEIECELAELAREHGTIILSSPYDSATTVFLARSSVTAGQMLYEDYLTLDLEQTLEDARRQVALSPQFAFPVLSESGHLIGILSKSDFIKPVTRQLILVDHNELPQAVSGADEIPIAEIIDHHRIGVAPTQYPILFLNRPVGSTSTIVATCYHQAGVPIPPRVAGILMCGLLSDTLNLTSPTTTDVDRAIMNELAGLAGVDPTELASEIFSRGSPLLTMKADQAVTADCKEYTERGRRFSVSQIEELGFSNFDEKKKELLEALEAYRASRDYYFSSLLVTDVNTQNSLLMVCGAEAYTKVIDFPDAEPHVWRLDGVVSRKKQLLPYLSSLLGRIA